MSPIKKSMYEYMRLIRWAKALRDEEALADYRRSLSSLRRIFPKHWKQIKKELYG